MGENFLKKARNNTEGSEGLFTHTELDVLSEKIRGIQSWVLTSEKEQKAQPLHEMPKMTAAAIAEKGLELDRGVKYLINKAKIAKAEKEREKRKKELDEKLAKEDAEKAKKA